MTNLRNLLTMAAAQELLHCMDQKRLWTPVKKDSVVNVKSEKPCDVAPATDALVPVQTELFDSHALLANLAHLVGIVKDKDLDHLPVFEGRMVMVLEMCTRHERFNDFLDQMQAHKDQKVFLRKESHAVPLSQENLPCIRQALVDFKEWLQNSSSDSRGSTSMLVNLHATDAPTSLEGIVRQLIEFAQHATAKEVDDQLDGIIATYADDQEVMDLLFHQAQQHPLMHQHEINMRPLFGDDSWTFLAEGGDPGQELRDFIEWLVANGLQPEQAATNGRSPPAEQFVAAPDSHMQLAEVPQLPLVLQAVDTHPDQIAEITTASPVPASATGPATVPALPAPLVEASQQNTQRISRSNQ